MPLSNLLKSAAGILSREHSQCRQTYQVGWQEMVQLDADAARPHAFDEKSLRITLTEIARRSYGGGATVNRVQSDLNGKVNPGTAHVPIRRDAQCSSALTRAN